MHSKLYIPARSATAALHACDVTPESAGWTETWLQVLELDDGQIGDASTPGGTEVMILPLAGGGTVDCGDETFDLSPRGLGVSTARPTWSMLGIGQEYRISPAAAGSRSAAPAPNARFPYRRVAAADVPVELRGAGNCSRQVHNFGTAGVFEADSLIACEVITPGGNWSSLPAAQARRGPPRRDRARGDLLLRDRPTARPVARLRLPPGVRHAGAADRGARRGPHRRRRAGAARLPRPVDRRARLPHVLPQRDGRPRRRTGLADRDDPAHAWLRGTWDDQAVDPGCPCTSRSVTVVSSAPAGREPPIPNRPSDSPSPRPPCGSSASQYVERDGVAHQVLRRLLRDLRPRQRGRARAGAAAGRGRRDRPAPSRAALRAGPQRAGDGAHRGRATPGRRTGCRPGPCTAIVGPGRDQHGHRRRAGHHQPAARAAAARRHLRHPGQRDPVLQELEHPRSGDVTVNDAFKPVSRFFDRV